MLGCSNHPVMQTEKHFTPLWVFLCFWINKGVHALVAAHFTSTDFLWIGRLIDLKEENKD